MTTSTKKFKLKSYAKYTGISLGLITAISIGSASYLFLTLDNHRKTIQKLVLEASGYAFNYDRLKTDFNTHAEPHLKITNLSLTNPQTKNTFFNLKELDLNLSYWSILYLQPIFSSIKIVGSSLYFEYNHKNDLILNDEVITNLAAESQTNFDFEEWFLNQKHIKINDLNLVLLDSKHKIQPFIVQNIDFENQNNDFQHSYQLKVSFAHSHLATDFNFFGQRLSEPRDWNDANLVVYNVGNQGYLVNLSAKVDDGQLKFIRAELDSNQQILKDYFHDLSTISNFKGTILFKQESGLNYSLSAPDLIINTRYGYLFDHASINGKIKLGQGGSLEVNKLKLAGINNLLKISKISNDLTMDGSIDLLRLNWQGKLLKPHDFNLISVFSDIKLSSQESNIPSFDNLSGTLNARESSGELNLALQNSTIDYPKFLYYPYKWKNFSSTLNWQLESNNKVQLSWEKTQLQTDELQLDTTGSYNQQKNQLSILANINYLNLPNLYRLLPKTVSASVVNDLKSNLRNGKITDLNIKLDGTPESFPFKSGGGKFTLNGNFSNVDYTLMPKWTPVTNLSGILTGIDQTITANIKTANLGQLQINNTKLGINDTTQDNLILIADGQILGTHNQFIDYITHSPYNAEVNQLEQWLEINGNAIAKFKAVLPLDHPQRLKLSGYYDVGNSQISLKQADININNIQGKVNFSQAGIQASNLTANMLDSDIELKALSNSKFELHSPNLNVSHIIESYFAPLESVITGQTQFDVSYDTHTNQLNVQSNLQGITINAPDPLGKFESETMLLQGSYILGNQLPQANLTIGNNIINAQAHFDKSNNLHKLLIGIGTNQFNSTSTHESAPIIVKAKLDNTFVNQWVEFFSTIMANKEKQATLKSTESTTSESNSNSLNDESSSLYPILFELNTNAIWLNNYNIVGGKISSLITTNEINTTINTPDIEGDIDYFIDENQVNAHLKRLIFSSANFYHGDLSQYVLPVSLESNMVYTQASESTLAFESTNWLNNQLNNKKSAQQYFDLEKLLQESATTLSKDNLAIESATESQIISNEPTTIPNINLIIDNLYLENYYWGYLSGNIYQHDDSLFIENFSVENNAATTHFNLVNHCLSCTQSEKYVAVNAHSDIKDFGLFITKADQGNIFKKGQGTLDISAIWQGGISDYQRENVVLRADIDINDGVLLKVNPGLFGALMGVINMSSINVTNLNHFNFNSFFGKSFAFKNFSSSLLLESDVLKIEKIQMLGDVANVNAFGDYYLESNTINTYLTVEPRLAGTAATTAGIVTLNPLIGVLVYIGEKLIGDPINKALAISYHVEGNVESPTMTQTKISKQLMQNFKSSLNFLKPDN